jgi:hypothetical protein
MRDGPFWSMRMSGMGGRCRIGSGAHRTRVAKPSSHDFRARDSLLEKCTLSLSLMVKM